MTSRAGWRVAGKVAVPERQPPQVTSYDSGEENL